MDKAVQFSSKRFVKARTIAMICFAILMSIMLCGWVLLFFHKIRNRSRGHRPRSVEDNEPTTGNRNHQQEDIEMIQVNI